MRSLVGTLVNRSPVPYVGRTNLAIPFRRPVGSEAQLAAMGANGTLFAIVDKLAGGTAMVDWKLYRKAASGLPEDRVEVTKHAALNLWNKPNDFFTRQEFVETVQQHHELTGEMWWVVSRDGRSPIPLELWPVRPDRMEPVPSAENYLAGYIYTGADGEKVPLGLDDVIFVRRPSPLDPYRGIGPVQAALIDIESARFAKEWNSNFFRNSAEPGGVVEIERNLTDPEFKLHQERWAEQHKGVSNAHRVALLEGGMKWVERKYTMRDMQFVELRGVAREDIREAFGFPKPMLGAVDDVNRANAEAAEYVMSKWLTVPRLERIKGALNSDYLTMFGPAATGLEFDYVTPVDEDEERANARRNSQVTAAVTLIAAGFDRAAVLEVVGLPEIETGAEGAADATPSDMAEMIQKLYLGVGTVVTWEEARAILVAGGVDLDLSIPPPTAAAAPALAPGEEPATEPAPEPATGRRVPAAARLRAADAGSAPNDWDVRLDALLAAWAADVSPGQFDDLVSQVEQIVDSGAPIDLAGLTVDSSGGAGLLAEAMMAQATAGARRVVSEAAAQGVTVTQAPVVGGLAADLSSAATVAATFLAGALAASAGRQALRVWAPGATGADVAEQVRSHLEQLGDSSTTVALHGSPRAELGGALRAELGGAIWAAENEGRFATIEQATVDGSGPDYMEADERNDTNTCGPCADVNGTRFDSIAAAQAQYPFGGYRECQGRARCRGTVRAVWNGD